MSKTSSNPPQKNNEIREFIYLNTDILESYMAQLYDGHIENWVSEELDTIETLQEEDRSTTNVGVDGTLSAVIAKLGVKIDYLVQSGADTEKTVKSAKNIVSKALSDNMYTWLFEYLTLKKKISIFNINQNTILDTLKVGQFILATGEFNYIDFNRIEILVSKSAIEAYEKNGILSDDDKLSKNKLIGIREKLPVLKEYIPFHALLIFKNMVVLIDEKYLRDKNVGYRLDGQINIMGSIRKISKSQTQESQTDVISTLNKIQHFALDTLSELIHSFDSKGDIYFVTPIAIYCDI